MVFAFTLLLFVYRGHDPLLSGKIYSSEYNALLRADQFGGVESYVRDLNLPV